jgi:hypothetical protein
VTPTPRFLPAARRAALLLALAAAACGRDAPAVDGGLDGVSLDVPGWRLERAATVGGEDADEDNMLYGAQIVSEDAEGRFYVLNFGDRRLQVFDSAGRFIRNVGRKGKGPGEFTSPMSAVPVGADGLFVLEAVPARLMRFRRSTGEFVGNVPIEVKQMAPMRMVLAPNGRVAVELRTLLNDPTKIVSASTVAWVDTATGEVQPVVQLDSLTRVRTSVRGPRGTRSTVMDPPFAPRPVWAPDGRDGVLYGDGSEFAVYRAAPGAAPALAFRGQGGAAAVTAKDRERVLSSPRGKLLEDYEFPQRKPFFSGLGVDAQGMVWVQRPGESGTESWEVRAPDGGRRGELRLPAGARMLGVSATSVYVVQKDELDVETLYRYRLIRGA